MAEPAQLRVGEETYSIFRLDALQARWDVARLPYTLRILLENVLRNGSDAEVEAVAGWLADAEPSQEISFMPARVLLQDFTGVPAIVDLAAMRDAMREQGGDPNAINPQIPAELVIDHSVQVDEFASRLAIERNVELEFERNRERYAFLRWGQGAFDDLKVVPPEHRHLPSGQPRVPGPRRRVPRRRRLPRHARRHRLAHDHGQRPRRPRLGRRRDRGGGRRCWARRSRCSCRRWSASG